MRSSLILIMIASFAFVACQSPTSNSPKDISIKGVGWYIQNAPADYWSAGSNPIPHLTYEVSIGLSSNTVASDLTEARIVLANGGYWALTPSQFDNSTHGWGGYRTHLYWSSDPAALPLGSLAVNVKLSDGRTLQSTLVSSQPGNTAQGPATVYTTEDSTPSLYASSGVAALKRPTAISAAKNSAGGSLVVHFTENDSNAYNGWIWLYDAAQNYLGGFFYLRDTTSHAVTTKLNSGAFSTAGSDNVLTLTTADLETSSGVTFTSSMLASVAQIRVIVTDGSQYTSLAGGPHYDYRALSSLTAVTGN